MLELDAITTLALACVLRLLGQAIVNNVSILMKLCIPAPVIVWLILQIVVIILQLIKLVTIELESELMKDFFMLAFYTILGLDVAVKLLRLGGIVLIVYRIFCGILATCQNILGVSLSTVLNIPPLLGL